MNTRWSLIAIGVIAAALIAVKAYQYNACRAGKQTVGECFAVLTH